MQRSELPALLFAGGGGCFPMHFDSDELLDGRRVSNMCSERHQ
jgi:hypothetical protein